MNKSVKKNYLYNLAYQILIIIIPLITTPYLSRVLGAEYIGIYSYTISVTTYFILFGSLGIAVYGQREIAYNQNNIAKRSKIFFEIFILKAITLSISLLIFYFSFCINGNYNVYYKILILEIVANIFDINWYYQGLEDFKTAIARNIIVKTTSIICIFIFIKSPDDLNKYLLIYVISTLFGNLSLWIKLPKHIKTNKLGKLAFKRHLKPIIMLFIPQIATQVYTVLDKTMIGTIILNKNEVGYYEQAQKIIKLMMTIATSLGTVMLPRIASTYAKGEKEKIKNYLSYSFAFIMMISFPLMFGMISIAYKFVPIFYGNGYDKVAPLICIMSPIIIFIGLSNVTGTQYLLPTNQQNKYTISVILGALTNFILNLILIKKYASIGAAIATIAAEFIVTIVQLILINQAIEINKLCKIAYKYVVAAIIMFLSSIIVGIIIKNNLLSIIIQIFVSCIIYISCLLVLKEKLIIESLNLLHVKRKKEK